MSKGQYKLNTSINLRNPIHFWSLCYSDFYNQALRRDGRYRMTRMRIIEISRCNLMEKIVRYIDTCPSLTYYEHFPYSPSYWLIETHSRGRPLPGWHKAEYESHMWTLRDVRAKKWYILNIIFLPLKYSISLGFVVRT